MNISELVISGLLLCSIATQLSNAYFLAKLGKAHGDLLYWLIEKNQKE